VVSDFDFRISDFSTFGTPKVELNHILEANGAFYDGEKGEGHAQKGQDIVFNIVQPYPDGPLKGLCPTLDIKHLEL
jgi:hypothetical protein